MILRLSLMEKLLITTVRKAQEKKSSLLVRLLFDKGTFAEIRTSFLDSSQVAAILDAGRDSEQTATQGPPSRLNHDGSRIE